MDIEQIEYCFDIANDEDGASLLINSPEQMFTEKLRSLLKFGRFSTRYKDIFDMYYLREAVNLKRLFPPMVKRKRYYDSLAMVA